MINDLGKRLTNTLINNQQIDESERRLYEYGFFLLISNVMYFAITFAMGSILKIISESIIFYIAFNLIRGYAGGYHASSELKCWVATTVSIFLCLGIVKLCNLYNIKTVIIFLTIVAAVLIFLLCPLDTPEKPLTIKEKKYFRKKSWKILLIILTIICLSLSFKINALIYPCSVSLILEGILLFLGKIKEIRKKNG